MNTSCINNKIVPLKECPHCKRTKSIYDFIIKRSTGESSVCCRKCTSKIKSDNITETKREKARVRRLMNMVNGTNAYTNFLNADLTGICAMCGEILLFGEFHHIFGEGVGLTVMLCEECHSRGNTVNSHCLSIGRRIAWGALCYY